MAAVADSSLLRTAVLLPPRVLLGWGLSPIGYHPSMSKYNIRGMVFSRLSCYLAALIFWDHTNACPIKTLVKGIWDSTSSLYLFGLTKSTLFWIPN